MAEVCLRACVCVYVMGRENKLVVDLMNKGLTSEQSACFSLVPFTFLIYFNSSQIKIILGASFFFLLPPFLDFFIAPMQGNIQSL